MILGIPSTVAANSGTTPQSAVVDAAFHALAVTVRNAKKAVLPGISVTFTAPASGASGLFSNMASTMTVATNGSGVASAPFTANGTAGGPYTVTASVAGVATPASFSLTNLAAISALKLSAASLNLGSVMVASTSASKTVKLTSSGTVSLNLTGIAASGDYAQTNNCPKSLAPAASCTVTITFTPSVAGSIAGGLTVTDNASNSPQVVSLTGTGVNVVSLAPASLTFPTVTVAATSASQTITLTNNSSSSVSLSFAPSADFTAVGNGTAPCGITLAAKAQCTVAVTFTPSQNGAINGALAVSGTSFATQVAALTGTGTGGATSTFTLNPTSMTFANQEVGASSATKTVTVTNSGASSVTILSLTASTDFVVTASGTKPCGGALAAKAKCTFSVTFTPSAAGAVKGTVAIANSSSVNPQLLDITATGALPVTLKPTSLTFAAQTVGSTSAPQTVTLTNNQSVGLSIVSLLATGDYTVSPGGTAPCGSSVAALGSCTFQVAFTPTTTGTIDGAVTVTHSAGGSPQAVKLIGVGE